MYGSGTGEHAHHNTNLNALDLLKLTYALTLHSAENGPAIHWAARCW